MAGGLQSAQTTFGVAQFDAVRICRENEVGQTGRIRPSIQSQGLYMKWRKLGAQVTLSVLWLGQTLVQLEDILSGRSKTVTYLFEKEKERCRATGHGEVYCGSCQSIPPLRNCFSVPTRRRSALTIRYHRLEAFDAWNMATIAA